MAVERKSACDRLVEKYGGSATHTEMGSQYRHTVADGLIVATWVMKKDRLSYASGFLFGDQTMRKLTARDVTALLS